MSEIWPGRSWLAPFNRRFTNRLITRLINGMLGFADFLAPEAAGCLIHRGRQSGRLDRMPLDDLLAAEWLGDASTAVVGRRDINTGAQHATTLPMILRECGRELLDQAAGQVWGARGLVDPI